MSGNYGQGRRDGYSRADGRSSTGRDDDYGAIIKLDDPDDQKAPDKESGYYEYDSRSGEIHGVPRPPPSPPEDRDKSTWTSDREHYWDAATQSWYRRRTKPNQPWDRWCRRRKAWVLPDEPPWYHAYDQGGEGDPANYDTGRGREGERERGRDFYDEYETTQWTQPRSRPRSRYRSSRRTSDTNYPEEGYESSQHHRGRESERERGRDFYDEYGTTHRTQPRSRPRSRHRSRQRSSRRTSNTTDQEKGYESARERARARDRIRRETDEVHAQIRVQRRIAKLLENEEITS